MLQYYETHAKLHQKFNEKLKEEVCKWGQFLCNATKAKDAIIR